MSTRRRRKSLRKQDRRCTSPNNVCLPTMIIDKEFQKNDDGRNPKKDRPYLATNKTMNRYNLKYFIFGVVFMMTTFLIFLNTNNQSLLPTSQENYENPVTIKTTLKPCAECRVKPKMVFYTSEKTKSRSQQDKDQDKRKKTCHKIDPMLHVNPSEETGSQSFIARDNRDENDDCVPMQKWQLNTFPTCNNIHELDLKISGGNRNEMKLLSPSYKTRINDKNDHFDLIGNGWFRNTWKFVKGSTQETVVLKTLRFEREFLHEYFELHRRESTAMERLTTSPYIINVYSFCGQSTVNEYANFIDGYQDFKSFAKQLRGKNEKKVLRLKLQIATMISLGIQHIHEINGPKNATMAHYDINPMNIVITAGGIPKINDFNVAEFIYWNSKKKERCGFIGRFKEPWWRSPEEMLWVEKSNKTRIPLLDEKVDIYSLGNVIYFLMTGYSPRGATSATRMKAVQQQVQKGIRPPFDRFDHKHFSTSDDVANVALRKVVEKCYQLDPTKRSSARDISDLLFKALDKIQDNQ